MGATTIKAIYQQKELDVTRAATLVSATIGAVAENTHTLSATSMGLSVAHTIDAMTLKAFTVSTSVDTTLSTTDATFVRSGIGASYSLGGGATFEAGYVQIDTPALTGGSYSSGTAITRGALSTTSSNVFDVGLNFAF